MPLTIVRGDITLQKADVIVNAANTSLLGGSGVDGAIHRAAGPELLAECRTLGGCETGEAKITKGYNLYAKYIVHTPGPVWSGGKNGEDKLLEKCYRNCLLRAREVYAESVAFPSISTGVYHFPLQRAAFIAVRTILDFLDEYRHPDDIRMVCFDKITQDAYLSAQEELEGR